MILSGDRLGNGRFEVLSRLGEGGMGSVVRALDTLTGHEVAIKIVGRNAGDALMRFKREFRSLQDLQHPNVVSLGELFEESGTWFFTMELIEGIDFASYVRGADASPHLHSTDPTMVGPGARASRTSITRHTGGYDESRLRDGFAQLATAVDALHRYGKVHRDLKPSNALVTREGRVVLLDFGLVTQLRDGLQETDVLAIGTWHYMAPEQGAGRPVGPPADWYALGVMLYELLVGVRPFEGNYLKILADKQHMAAPRPSDVDPGVPRDLDDLAHALLATDPEARPTGREVLRRLGRSVPDDLDVANVHGQEGNAQGHFVGRSAERARLHARLAASQSGGLQLVVLEGGSGIGKSALVHAFVDEIVVGSTGAVALAGTCHERESVAFKAFDGVVDELGRWLKRRQPDELVALLPEQVGALARVFPVLERVDKIKQAHAALAFESFDRAAIRTRAFAAFRGLISRIGADRPLVLVIDDLQWADADSAQLLSHLLTGRDSTPALVVATMRDDAELSPELRRIVKAADEHIRLGALDESEARELARDMLETRRGEAGESSASMMRPDPSRPRLATPDPAALGVASQGHPYLLSLLARASKRNREAQGTPDLDRAIGEEIAALDPASRTVLTLVCATGRPIARDVLGVLSGLSQVDLDRAWKKLRAARLVRTSVVQGSQRAQSFHPRIVRIALSSMGAEDLRRHHRAMVEALEASSTPDPDALAWHSLNAGDVARFATWSVAAGDRAMSTVAFARAAASYRDAIESGGLEGDDRARASEKLGDALASLGRGEDAARAYEASMALAPPEARTSLLRRSAESWLVTGHAKEGLEALRDLFARLALPFPRSMLGVLFALARSRLRVALRGYATRPRPPGPLDARAAEQVDACFSATKGLLEIDPLLAQGISSHGLALAIDLGDEYRTLRMLGLELGYLAGAQARGTEAQLALAKAFTARAEKLGVADAIAIVLHGRALARYLEGDFREALALHRRELDLLAEQGAGSWWEISQARTTSLECSYWLGDFRPIRRDAAVLVGDALARGDVFTEAHVRTRFLSFDALLDDDVVRAREELEKTRISSFSHRFARGFATVLVDLYEGDALGAHQRYLAVWRRLLFSPLIGVSFTRVLGRYLIGASAAAAYQAGDASALRTLKSASRWLGRERTPWSKGLRSLLVAMIAFAKRDEATGLAALRKAEQELTHTGLGAFATSVRLARALREGDAAAREAERTLAESGAMRPLKLASVLVPGVLPTGAPRLP